MTAAVVKPKATGTTGIQCGLHFYKVDLTGHYLILVKVNNGLALTSEAHSEHLIRTILRLFSVDLSEWTQLPLTIRAKAACLDVAKEISADPL